MKYIEEPLRQHQRKPAIIAIAAACILAGGTTPGWGVVLDDENRMTVVLQGGTQVSLIGEATATSGTKGNRYYYLPVNLRLARRADKTPEFLLLKYTTESRAEKGGVQGGLLHFLTEWGLEPQQEEELRGKLKKEHGNAELMGAVPVMPDGDTGSFQIISATLTDKSFAPSVIASGKAPLVPGGKAAAAARLTAEGAQLLDATLSKSRSIADVTLQLSYAYETLVPAARGRITFDWSKLEKQQESLDAEYKRKQTGTRKTSLLGITVSSSPTYSYSYDEMKQQYDFLVDKKIITMQWDETIKDDRLNKIRDAFFQYFVNAMAQPAQPEGGTPPPPSKEEKEKHPNIRYGNSYRFKQTSIKSAYSRKTTSFEFNGRLTISRPHPLTGNIGEWYDGVRDNPKCVASVNLNDPFFQHRDIKVVVDLVGKDVFESMVNYVTINVRKKRSSGRPFEDHATIDADYLKTKGVAVNFTYARGEDTDADVYEYQSQWSLRGGYLFPADPPWVKGNWEGVTLKSPIEPHTIEVEADLEAMKSSHISRITAQVHYPRFGEEVEENIPISASQGQALISRKLYFDAGTRGYAYRLIVNHDKQGKLVLPWSARLGDDYIKANIPEDLLVEGSPAGKTAKDAGTAVPAGGVEKVLKNYDKIFGDH